MFGSYTIRDGGEQMEMSSEFPPTVTWVSRSTSDLHEVKKSYDAPKLKFVDGSSFQKPKILLKLAGRSSSSGTDAKDLLSHSSVSSPPSPPRSLASSSPSAKGKYVPPARRRGPGSSQPSSWTSPSPSLSSSPSSSPSSSTSSSPSYLPSSSPSYLPSSSPSSSSSSSSSSWESSPSVVSTNWRRYQVMATSSGPEFYANPMAGAPTPGAGLKKAAPCSKKWWEKSTELSSSLGGPMTACQRSCQARLQRQENLRRRYT